jgi:hypothetical protein
MSEGQVEVSERLGGLLQYYRREAGSEDVRGQLSFRTLRAGESALATADGTPERDVEVAPELD